MIVMSETMLRVFNRIFVVETDYLLLENENKCLKLQIFLIIQPKKRNHGYSNPPLWIL